MWCLGQGVGTSLTHTQHSLDLYVGAADSGHMIFFYNTTNYNNIFIQVLITALTRQKRPLPLSYKRLRRSTNLTFLGTIGPGISSVNTNYKEEFVGVSDTHIFH